MTLAELHACTAFSTDPKVIKENAERIGTFIKEKNGEVRVAQALRRAVWSLCPHKNTRSYYDGGTCEDCGWSY